MDMRQRILDYPKWILDKQTECDEEVTASNLKSDADVGELSSKIVAAKNSIAIDKAAATNKKAQIQKGVQYLLKKKAEDSLKSFMDPFGFTPSHSFDRVVTEADLQADKTELYNLYSSIKKNLNEVIPELEEKKAKEEEIRAKNAETIATKYEAEIDEYVNALKEDYAKLNPKLPLQSKEFTPASKIPTCLRLGNYLLPVVDPAHPISQEDTLKTPFELSLKDSPNLFLRLDSKSIHADGDYLENVLAGIMATFITSFPAGKLEYSLYSPFVNAFPKLRATFLGGKGRLTMEPSTLLTPVELYDLASRLNKQNEEIEELLLKHSKASLFDLYEAGIEGLPPFRLYVIQSCFGAIEMRTMELLSSAVLSSAKCGTFFVFAEDLATELIASKSSQFTEKLSDILSNCSVFEVNGGKVYGEGDETFEFVSTSSLSAQETFDMVAKLVASLPEKTYEEVLTSRRESEENSIADAYERLTPEEKNKYFGKEVKKQTSLGDAIKKFAGKTDSLKFEEIKLPDFLEGKEISGNKSKEPKGPMPDPMKVDPTLKENADFIAFSAQSILLAQGVNRENIRKLFANFEEIAKELAAEGVEFTAQLLMQSKLSLIDLLKDSGVTFLDDRLIRDFLAGKLA